MEKRLGDRYLDRVKKSIFSFFLRHGLRSLPMESCVNCGAGGWGEQVNLNHLIDVYGRLKSDFPAMFSLL
jgi:hypothetical protein